LLGDLKVRQQLEAGEDPRQIFAEMASARQAFEAQRAEFLIYD
jgi:hypothetical protein